ncbi:MAG: CotH kinase family protein [Saprospiraceae bacterium]
MYKISILFFFLALSSLSAQTLFEEKKVNIVRISIDDNYLKFIYNNPQLDTTFKADYIYTDGINSDTIKQIGFSLRGNTSRGSAKKSFKLSFNEYSPGKKYQGVKKVNLLGSHNDPTQIREKLFYYCWGKFGLPERKASFVRVFINNNYYGLYTQIEEFDKDWCEKAFGNNGGNLYKCRYPADLAYLGSNQAAYKAIKHSATERAYDLKTNETADNYSDLLTLCAELDKPIGSDFETRIQKVLDVKMVLKAFALEVMSGDWDDYAYNKNNYYLYKNTKTGKFEYMTYDTDNTFGVDWLGQDWVKKDVNNWLPKSPEKRPLVSKLLGSYNFNQMYLRYVDTISRITMNPDTIFPYISGIHNMIRPFIQSDPYYPLDYGYSMKSFAEGLTKKVDSHTPYGIFPFINGRIANTRQQLDGILAIEEVSHTFRIYPNPVNDYFFIDTDLTTNGTIKIYDALGRIVQTSEVNFAEKQLIQLNSMNAGIYEIQLCDQYGKCQKSVRVAKQ